MTKAKWKAGDSVRFCEEFCMAVVLGGDEG